MKIKTLYQDNSCAVINKPAGIVVHNPPNIHGNSVAHWWISQTGVAKSGWQDTERAGVVHRLDTDTSGALLLAKSPYNLEKLQTQFKKREVKKKYLAITFNEPSQQSGEIKTYIDRNKKERAKRSASLINLNQSSSARLAVSRYRVIASGKINQQNICIIEFDIKTGRTHQIRLHAKMLGCPILGDAYYCTKTSRKLSKKLDINRQMLHAYYLQFIQPENQKLIIVTAPLFCDMLQTIKKYFPQYKLYE